MKIGLSAAIFNGAMMCKKIDIIDVNAYRKTKQLEQHYRVKYFMKKGSDPYKINDIKYKMEISFCKFRFEHAVVIGQNPSICKTCKGYKYNVDDTNWNIIKVLKKLGFGGYTMLNMCPIIGPRGKSFSSYNKDPVNLKFVMREIKSAKKPIILAAGVSNWLPLDFCEQLEKYKDKFFVIKNDSKLVTHFSTMSLGGIKKSYFSINKIARLVLEQKNLKKNRCHLKIESL